MTQRSAAIIRVEDTIADVGKHVFPAVPPIDVGVRVARDLSYHNELFFLTSDEHPYRVQHWLVVTFELSKPPRLLEGSATSAVSSVRTLGYDATYYVDGSPSRCAEAMRTGTTALVMASPVYARPEFRPEAFGPVREWDDIVAEVDEQRRKRLADTRLEVDPVDARFTKD